MSSYAYQLHYVICFYLFVISDTFCTCCSDYHIFCTCTDTTFSQSTPLSDCPYNKSADITVSNFVFCFCGCLQPDFVNLTLHNHANAICPPRNILVRNLCCRKRSIIGDMRLIAACGSNCLACEEDGTCTLCKSLYTVADGKCQSTNKLL